MKTNRLHFFYDQLTDKEREFVEGWIEEIMNAAKDVENWKLAGDDTCEEFCNAFAKYIIDSRP